MRSTMCSESTKRSENETPRVSRPSSRPNGWKPGAAVILLLITATATACGHRVETIQDRRTPVANPDGSWSVTDGWLQEQAELVRGWRAQAQACHVELMGMRKDDK